MAAPTERLMFSSLVESYLKGLGPLFTPKAHLELKAAGLDVEKIPPAIPAADMLRFIEIFARHAWPHEQRTEALRLLGLHAIRGWASTLLGSATAGLMKVMGPHRTLTRLHRAFRTTNNFSEATTQLVGDKEALITIQDVLGLPTYWQGILQAGCEAMGIEARVVIDKQLPGPDATYRITWK